MDKPEEHVTTPTNKEERKRQSDEQVMKAAAEKKAVTEEEEDQPAAVLPPRRKMLGRRTKPKERPTKTKFYPFITTEEKALIGDWASKKQVIRQRALAWNEQRAEEEIRETIKNLGWKDLCAEPGEAVLPVVKEFYENQKGKIEGFLSEASGQNAVAQ